MPVESRQLSSASIFEGLHRLARFRVAILKLGPFAALLKLDVLSRLLLVVGAGVLFPLRVPLP